MSPESCWVTHPDRTEIEVLRVPSQAQPDDENSCLAYSVWDILHYVAEWHPTKWVRDETPKLDISEIKKFLKLRPSGWVPENPGEELDISEETGAVRFVHRYWESPPPTAGFYQLLERKLDKNSPTITMIDTRAIEEGVPGEGPLHSVVVTGMSESSVATNNPWGRQHEIFNKQEFVDAWNARNINQIIRVDIVEQSTLQTSLPMGDQ